MEVMFPLMFFLIFGLFLFILISNLMQWGKNNRSPRLTVPVTVVAKRTHRSHHKNHTSSSYYVTFQVESGDRMELHVPTDEYGYLVEGDVGRLTFQGTRYLSFEREYVK